ncbi:MAG TPA: flagellar assembly protein FliX [Ferrovibrio sp.]|uniref:flagellar assembly protein FliX n=1 Tax=Ferrovibrio sp. TaxID=1917215 RepID=UPI002B4B349A|nr:flagellar assembly protein FliX [Ferrovibrio sp.]HLT76193.1 flagellar assembly protein FliX [Ferrovibrio sp.]
MSINKIGGPGGIKPGAPKRSSGTGSTGDTSFSSLLKPVERPSGQVGQTAPVAALDAMLTVQSVDDQGGGNRRNRQRAFERGSGLLEHLDEIRLGLLEGRLPAAKLQALAQLLRSEKLHVEDPRQAEVLAEIELRCAVELAKLGL